MDKFFSRRMSRKNYLLATILRYFSIVIYVILVVNLPLLDENIAHVLFLDLVLLLIWLFGISVTIRRCLDLNWNKYLSYFLAVITTFPIQYPGLLFVLVLLWGKGKDAPNRYGNSDNMGFLGSVFGAREKSDLWVIAIKKKGLLFFKRFINWAHVKPFYSESSIVLMFLSTILLYGFSEEFRADFWLIVDYLPAVKILLTIFVGFVVTFFGVFRSPFRTKKEIDIMITAALFMSAFAALSSFAFSVKYSQTGLLNIFPIFNLLQFTLIPIALWLKIYSEQDLFTGKRMTIFEFLFSMVFIGPAIFVCINLFEMHWSIVFSMVVAYMSTFGASMVKIFPGLNRMFTDKNT